MNTHSSAQYPRRLLVGALCVAVLGLLLWVIARLDAQPRTDDAYAYADTVNVTPQVSGRIVELPVRENQPVHQGDVLMRIDPRPYQVALDEARAALVELDQQIGLNQRQVNAQRLNAEAAHAEIERAQALAKQSGDTLRRQESLLSHGYISAEAIDQSRTSRRSALSQLNVSQLQARQATAAVSGVEALVAHRAVIEAQIARAALNVEYSTVRASFDGRVVGLKTTVGQFASAGQPVFSLIDTQHWYVVANFRETELKNIRPGDPSTVYLMSDTRQTFAGNVDSIGFGVLPDDGGTDVNGLPKVARSINWVRVSQRFPVRIRVNGPDLPSFRIGASAVAVVNTGSGPAQASSTTTP
ncbi:multidrug transporter subunit MdtN [Pseudomonas batumici]|uniref:Inner membrane component of tripartite multidrug resistance system n=1 Tax=Pseudomonas batumici TaxID=226910 RepID=A0A0C2ECB8_9PSED|nr:multidrug transporter subunit MdtN [Pseudomonas batumici]KIH83544.1 Inner membrane component of tripartite multidrug resistance system [Pseudomonas batumici]